MRRVSVDAFVTPRDRARELRVLAGQACLELFDPCGETPVVLGPVLMAPERLTVVPGDSLQELVGRLAVVSTEADGQLARIDFFRSDRHRASLERGSSNA